MRISRIRESQELKFESLELSDGQQEARSHKRKAESEKQQAQ